ncbi:hypothetical protein QFZ96_004568 [Paraburkholderia youngii]|nr:hypothetical protein [Paraburkholderia atlantica]
MSPGPCPYIMVGIHEIRRAGVLCDKVVIVIGTHSLTLTNHA